MVEKCAFILLLESIEMESLLAVSGSTSLLLGVAAVVIVLFLADRARQARAAVKARLLDAEYCGELQSPPGPRAWPIIGNLHLLAGYPVAYQAFGPLAQRYGSVFKLSLGSMPCVVVNGLANIKEVLVAKGAQFDGRPNFRRYHELFCGDKENCEYSSWTLFGEAFPSLVSTLRILDIGLSIQSFEYTGAGEV